MLYIIIPVKQKAKKKEQNKFFNNFWVDINLLPEFIISEQIQYDNVIFVTVKIIKLYL